MLQAEIKNGKLVVTIDFDEKGQISASGKSRVHASTRGNQATSTLVNGKPLTIGLNAYTKS